MFRLFNRFVYLCAALMVLAFLAACSGGGPTGIVGTGGTTGTLGLGLTDAPGDYLNVFVTIEEVQVNQDLGDEESGWLTVLTPGETFDLLELQNGVIADLGLAELEAGDYNQMRLILGTEPDDPVAHPFANYLIIEGEADPVELKVPSGLQTGIKIVQGFTIIASGATELILDFDAQKSVHQAGKSGQWLMKPTIKVLESVANSVGGLVESAEGLVEGTQVTAQTYDDLAADPKDEVMVEGGTTSAADGTYFMYLAPGTYNMVAMAAGFLPECVEVAAEFFEAYTADFFLDPVVEAGTLSGLVSGLAAPEDSATISIRQPVDCGSGLVMIEVASVNIVNDTVYGPIALPAGTYQIVASSDGETTQVFGDIDGVGGIVVVDTTETVQDIDFTPAP
jgi:hypothetical protein